MDGGAANSSYVITTQQGRFVLSICDEKTHSDVKVQTELLINLERYNFPATPLCKNIREGYVLTHDRKPVIMKHYIEGLVPEYLNPKMTADLGKWVARLNRIPCSKDLPESFPYGVDIFSNVIKSFPKSSFSLWLNRQRQKFQKQIPQTLPRGLIHGDIFCDNLVYDNDSLVAVLDFEEACNYFYVFDIGMTIVGCCSKNGHTDWNIARIFLDAYESVRPLSSEERKCVPIMIEYAATSTAFWRYRQYNIRNPNATKKNIHTEMVQVAQGVSDLTIEQVFRSH